MKCSKDGKSGWKFGESGHCYTGPDAKKKAVKQGAAIKSQSKGEHEKFKREVLHDLSLPDFTKDEALSIADDLGFSYTEKLTLMGMRRDE